MAANNQLDVYKIILKKKKGFNFKTLITSRYVQDQETNYRNSGLFNLLYKEEFYKLKYCSTVVYMVPRA